jgi:BlaI family penicillinase repressor
MGRSPGPPPTDVQLELLRIVWRLGEATVREVLESLPKRRKLAYTTVMTMMQVLERKGYLTHTVRERAYVYRPTLSEEQVTRGMVKRFVDRLFGGSPELLVVKLLEASDLSEAQLEALRQKVEAAKRRKQARQ